MTSGALTQIKISHHFNTSAEHIFDAFLDPDRAGKFLFIGPAGEAGVTEIDPTVGGMFAFTTPRDDATRTGEFVVIDRPHQLVFSLTAGGEPDAQEQVSIEFKPQTDGCELTLTHSVDAHQQHRCATLETEWAHSVDAHQQHRCAALETEWAHMLETAERVLRDTLFVREAIEVQASAEKIWQVLTEQAYTAQWVGLWWADTVMESDWQQGSSIVWKLRDGATGAQGQVITRIPYRLLRYTVAVDLPNKHQQETLTFVLHEAQPITELSVSMGDFGDSLEHRSFYSGAAESWQLALARIKHLAEQA